MDDNLLLMIVVTLGVALLVWGVYAIVASAMDPEKKKLQERLTGGGKSSTVEPEFAKQIRRETVIPGISGALANLPGLMPIHKSLEVVWPSINLVSFLGMVIGLAFVGFTLGFAIFNSFLIGAAGAFGLGFVPFFILNMGRNGRQRLLSDQLPEALDFLSRILRSGHSLSTGLQMMSEELPEPLSSEFRRCYDSHSLGLPLEEALKDTAVRVNSADFGFFVTAVLIQRQTGGDLSEVLGNISGMIRGRIRLQQHVKAKTAEGRFTGYILTAFPILMFFISYALNPKYAGVLLTGEGIYLLLIAGGLCGMGLFCIRKITQVKV